VYYCWSSSKILLLFVAVINPLLWLMHMIGHVLPTASDVKDFCTSNHALIIKGNEVFVFW
jgi:hypothetical protein